MTPVELSNAAIADLAEILSFGTATFGQDTGEKYVAGFEECLALIAAHPLVGAVHYVVQPSIRSIAHGRHRVYYDVFDAGILVQRILHHAMDIEQHL